MSSCVDESALYANDCRVRSIVGAKFGKDVLDSPFDGVLCDRKLISNLLVGIPPGNQA